MKGLIRKRSTTAARLQRAFSAKSLRTAPTTPLATAVSSNGGCEVDSSSTGGASLPATPCSHGQSGGVSTSNSSCESSPREKRQFIMETPVLFINVRSLCSALFSYRKMEEEKVFLIGFVVVVIIIKGSSEPRSPPVPLQRLVVDRQSAFWRSL